MEMDRSELFDVRGVLNFSAVLILFKSFTPEEQDTVRHTLGMDAANMDQFLQSLTGSNSSSSEQSRKTNVVVNNSTASLPLDSFLEFRLHKALLFYVPPIFFVIGVVGNLLSFVILTRRPMRRVSTYHYLAVLSLTDTLVLTVGLLRLWLGQVIGTDLQDMAQWTCKMITILGYTISNYSVWLIVAVTVERFVVVWFPLLVPSMCQPKRSVRVIVAVFCVQLLIHLHFLWTTELRHSADSAHCTAAESYQTLIYTIWPWVDTAIYSFIPFIIILVFNVLIILKVVISKRDRNTMCQSSRSKMADSGKKLSIMLLSVSFTFLVTTVPMNTILIITSLWWQSSNPSVIGIVVDRAVGSRFLLFRTLTELLMYINHSTNFFLYCATGHKFRLQLYSLFSRPKLSPRTALSSQHCVSVDKRMHNAVCMADL